MPAPDYIDEPAAPAPKRSPGARIDILTYAAADPENTPPPLRGMARALVNGRGDLPIAYGATPEEAGAKLRAFYDAEMARIDGAKSRGRPKRTLEAEEVDFGEII